MKRKRKKQKAEDEAKKAKDAAAAAAADVTPSKVLVTLISPPCEFRLARGASPYLFLQSTAPCSKKVAKFTVLLRVPENATLSTKLSGGPAFELSGDSVVFL